MRGFAKTWRRMGRAGVALVTAVALLAPLGCVKKPQKDAFIEHWNTMAQKSEGYTPVSRPRKVEFSKAAIVAKKEEKPEAKPARKLPTMKVTLRMYDTDLVAVVRAMARAANQNVVLSSAIPGAAGGDKALRININVVDAPWDETFTSILSANGLAYAVDGDIVKVMTLADMEQQNKLKEASNKLSAEKTKAKALEPFVMARVEINFAELPKIYATLSAMCGSTAQAGLAGQNKDGQSGQPKPGETVRDITPTSATGDGMSINAPGGARNPGQLNCSVVPDQHSNSIIIQGPPDDAERLVALIEELDKPRPQVKLKAFIVQTDRETGRQLGVQWGGLLKNSNMRISPAQTGTATTTTATGNTATTTSTIGTGANSGQTGSLASNSNSGDAASSATASPIFPGGTSGQGFGMNFPALNDSLTSASGLGAAGAGVNFLFGNIAGNTLEVQLTALAEENKIKILSSPTITTMENLSAFVENGVDVPYVSTSQNGTNVQFAHATLKLEMLPHVVDGSNLRMKIVVKDDQVDTQNTVQGNPFIYKRETQSNLVVEDGDTIVISGLTRDTIGDNESGVPYLSDIPGLGWAFKTKGSSIKREEIYIFVTPTILKDKPIAPVPAGDARGFPPVAEAALTPKP
ncbi:type II and III secretion system protein [Desulfovibrio aerotolerans]|uniref:Type II and III secretion system protein n=1 Tax=Solidesulfovibrio aerotolerans TaxID=295255 RepID=A0A7C9MJV6_9BACT|nr:secretin N-terminal domain-containing protein [Solidesulfovibrio aerotolerans]MYL82413.1 type II and III secretion system protein [Solidesulfovibrio aerotolerans]